MKIYRTGDNPNRDECAALNMKWKPLQNWGLKDGLYIAAVRAFEFRPPKAGEWYLSGADENGQPAAYRAPNDLSMSFHIAKLAVIDRKTTIRETVQEQKLP